VVLKKSELSTFFTNSAVQLIFSDIDQSADCDIYADAHHLPFEDQAFDGVITTAVLEHVLDPWCVAREIVRVTKYSGIVYSELPFLQGVHEGAYDFTRFTMGGHRNLFSQYRELDSGVVAGPGTAFVWAISSLFRSLFKSDRLSVCTDLMSRILFGWVKYVDYLIARHPIAEDFASCTYFYGEKKRVPLSPGELIDAYKRKHCDHLN
jgi:Methylase involved in ubiquinone/menaquinone biosynthesis